MILRNQALWLMAISCSDVQESRLVTPWTLVSPGNAGGGYA
jgi:hypothetical protein